MPTEEEILRSLRPEPSSTTLHAVALKAHELREVELNIQDLEERLKTLNARRHEIMREELPELMDQAQTDRVGIPANGNYPAYDAKLTPFYKAAIGAKWPKQKQQEAFDALTELGHQDLIKTEITVTIPRESRAAVPALQKFLTSRGYQSSTHEWVHHGTLTAWLKAQVEAGNPLPKLATIGAEIGRIVRLTERK